MQSFNDRIFLGGNMEYNDEEIDIVLDDLIKKGLVEEAGIDLASGQQTYRITEKGKQMLPEIYEESLAMHNMICFSLWDKNMINLSFDEEDGLPMIALNKNSFDEEKIKLLPEAEKFVLRQLVLTISDIEEFIRDLDDII
jgi:predicted transcriptional regulator